MITIARVETEAQYDQIDELMAEFIDWDSSQVRGLGLDAQEMVNFYYTTNEESLPKAYAPPYGCLLLATKSLEAAGCGAFRKLMDDTCELKRMYVRPEYRGMHIGRQLAETLITTARDDGYRIMRLETTTFMQGAIALYLSLGFRTCEPYYEIPRSFGDITVFMNLDLRC